MNEAHLQQEGGAHGFHPHFHQVRALLPRRTQSIRRAQVLIQPLVARPVLCLCQVYVPAPRTTLESPFHNDLKPSTLDTVTRALAMEFVYVAVGPGLMTCILVWPAISTSLNTKMYSKKIAYFEHVDRVHHRVFLMRF